MQEGKTQGSQTRKAHLEPDVFLPAALIEAGERGERGVTRLWSPQGSVQQEGC